jgi:hypothetical protein
MTRVCWWLADVVSRVLEPDERDIVHGDLAESRETGGHALCDVIGLVARRQVALWHDWRPWLVLFGLVVPLALLLSLVSIRVARMSSVYSWMYFNNSDWSLIQHRAFWIVLAQTIALVFPDILALVCLSWTIGFMLGALSRRTILVNGALFCLVLLFAEFVAVPQYMRLQLHSLQVTLGQGPLAPHLHDNDAVSTLTFYSVMFPLLVQIVLVLLPSFWGMYKGFGSATIPFLLRTIIWAPALAKMAVLAAMQGVWWAALATHNWAWLQRSWQIPPLLFAVAGPVVYVATASWQRWRMAKPHDP